MSYSETYTELETIGTGNYGQCLLIQHNKTGEICAAKKISTRDLQKTGLVQSQQEAELLKRLQHPNIVSYKESFTEHNLFVIIMEYCQQGDLSRLILKTQESGNHFPEQQVISWFYQLSSALEFIHSQNILHRDIKPSNIFLTKEGILKLGDFGISKILSGAFDVAHTMVGTPLYMSPEHCERSAYASKSDIWALGCVFYEICSLRPPFTSSNFASLISKIAKDSPDRIPSHYSQSLECLILEMLTKDPDLRISSKEILRSEVFQDYLINPMVSVDAPLSSYLDTSINPLEICNTNETGVLNLPNPDYPVSISDIEGSMDEADIPQDEQNNLMDDDENVVINAVTTMPADSSDAWNQILPRARSHVELIAEKKDLAIRDMGSDCFKEVYSAIRKFREDAEEEDIIFTSLQEKFPFMDIRKFFVVDQVIYYESLNE